MNSRLDEIQASILNITQDLKRTQTHLWTQFEKNENLKTSLNSTENALKITEAERDQFSAIKRYREKRKIFKDIERQLLLKHGKSAIIVLNDRKHRFAGKNSFKIMK